MENLEDYRNRYYYYQESKTELRDDSYRPLQKILEGMRKRKEPTVAELEEALNKNWVRELLRKDKILYPDLYEYSEGTKTYHILKIAEKTGRIGKIFRSEKLGNEGHYKIDYFCFRGKQYRR